MNRSCLVTLAAFIPAIAASEEPFTLLCKANAYGQSLAKNLVIDYQHGTVNGTHAKITDSVITWHTTEKDPMTGKPYPVDHELNRHSGTYHAKGTPPGVIPTPPAPPTYHCEKGSAKKF